MKPVTGVRKTIIRLLFPAVCLMLAALASCGGGEPEDQSALIYVSATDIVINEVLASNSESAPAYDGRYYDWVELYNPLPAECSLDGFYLSDDSDQPQKCSLKGQTVPAHGYLLIYCSGLNITDELGCLHTNFKLSASKGETVCLSDANGITTFTLPASEPNVSYGLKEGVPQRFDKPTPGAPNGDGSPLPSSDVVINELMTSNTYILYDIEGDYGDWVEIRNTSDSPTDISGYGLTDDVTRPFAFVFPEGTVLPGGGYLLVWCDGKNKTDSSGALHTGFSLSGDDSGIMLFTKGRTLADSVEIPGMPDNISCGRVDGDDKLRFFARPTPGAPNDTPWTAVSQGMIPDINNGVLISEVLSASSARIGKYPTDYIEIYNSTGSAVNMKGYSLSQRLGESFFTFPEIKLAAGDYLLVWCDGKTDLTPGSLHAPIGISAGGERFYLSEPGGRVCDVFLSGKCRAGMSSGRVGSNATRRVFFANPTPGSANGAVYYEAFAPVPTASIPGGVVASGTKVSLSAPEGFTVVYTLDGSVPGESSALYKGPVEITSDTVLRAVCVRSGWAVSDPLTNTYWVEKKHTLPIVSVSGNPSFLTGSWGILTSPTNGMEYPVHVEYYDADCRKAVEFDCGAHHFGAASLKQEQKALKLVMREIYGCKEVSYDFFADNPDSLTTFSSLLIRPSGQDQVIGKMRDELVCLILRGQNSIDYQEVQPCVLYVNGAYWGLYYVREALDANYLLNHHGLEKGSYDLIKTQSSAQEGNMDAYRGLMNYVHTHDLTDPECYSYITSQIDVDSLINFWIIETYFNNADSGNVRCYQGQDGKWRWIPYDFDLCMYNLRQMRSTDFIRYNMLNPAGHSFSKVDNEIIRKLILNDTFRDRFITLYCWHLRHTFNPERTVPIAEQLTGQIESEVKLNLARWGFPEYGFWKTYGPETLCGYLREKPSIAEQQLRSNFGLSDEQLAEYYKKSETLSFS